MTHYFISIQSSRYQTYSQAYCKPYYCYMLSSKLYIGATIWCLEGHHVFGVFVINFINPTNTLDIDMPCPPSLQLPRSSQTWSTLIYIHTYMKSCCPALIYRYSTLFDLILIRLQDIIIIILIVIAIWMIKQSHKLLWCDLHPRGFAWVKKQPMRISNLIAHVNVHVLEWTMIKIGMILWRGLE